MLAFLPCLCLQALPLGSRQQMVWLDEGHDLSSRELPDHLSILIYVDSNQSISTGKQTSKKDISPGPLGVWLCLRVWYFFSHVF